MNDFADANFVAVRGLRALLVHPIMRTRLIELEIPLGKCSAGCGFQVPLKGLRLFAIREPDVGLIRHGPHFEVCGTPPRL